MIFSKHKGKNFNMDSSIFLDGIREEVYIRTMLYITIGNFLDDVLEGYTLETNKFLFDMNNISESTNGVYNLNSLLFDLIIFGEVKYQIDPLDRFVLEGWRKSNLENKEIKLDNRKLYEILSIPFKTLYGLNAKTITELKYNKIVFKKSGLSNYLEESKRVSIKEEALELFKKSNELIIIDKEDELSGTFSFDYAGISEGFKSAYEQVSYIMKIPISKLLGQAPAGMNATGEYDSENYQQTLNSYRKNYVEPILERLKAEGVVRSFQKPTPNLLSRLRFNVSDVIMLRDSGLMSDEEAKHYLGSFYGEEYFGDPNVSLADMEQTLPK